MLPEIHQASLLELYIVQGLIQKIWKPTYREILSEEQIAYMLDRMYAPDVLTAQMEAGHIFLIIKEDNVPVGFAAYECNYGQDKTCKLHKIYLLPETQGKGLGKMLLNEVMLQAKEKGQERLLLNVNRYNKAIDFYKHYGFSVIAEEDIDIGNGYFMNDYLMEIKLT